MVVFLDVCMAGFALKKTEDFSVESSASNTLNTYLSEDPHIGLLKFV